MIILTIILLAAGILAIFVPVMTQDIDLFLGEQDYDELREQFSRQSTDSPRNGRVKSRIFWFGEPVDVSSEVLGSEQISQAFSTTPAQAQQTGANVDACQSENSEIGRAHV